MIKLSNPKVIAFGLAGAVFIIVSLAIVFTPTKKPSSSATSAVPNPSATPVDAIAYTGDDTLINQGMIAGQVDAMKFSFYKFYNVDGKKLKSADITNANSVHDKYSSVPDIMSFNVTFNQKDSYSAKMNFSDLGSIELYFYDNSGHQIFDSGIVKVQSGD